VFQSLLGQKDVWQDDEHSPKFSTDSWEQTLEDELGRRFM
jgi:hypothetical protein